MPFIVARGVAVDHGSWKTKPRTYEEDVSRESSARCIQQENAFRSVFVNSIATAFASEWLHTPPPVNGTDYAARQYSRGSRALPNIPQVFLAAFHGSTQSATGEIQGMEMPPSEMKTDR